MNWNTAAYAPFPYPITAKGTVWQDNPELGQQAGKEFSKLFLQVFEKNKEPEREIRQCIAKWPENAYFKFLLAECIHRRDAAEGDRVLETMITDHPDALFSRALLLRGYLTQDAPLPDFVKEGLFPELNAYYPDRVSFHPFEVYFFEHNIHLAAVKLGIAAQDAERHLRYIHLKQGDMQLAIWEHDSPDAYFEAHDIFNDEEDDEDEEDDDDYEEDEFEDDYDEDEDYDEEDDEEDPESIARTARLDERLRTLQTTEPPRFTLAATEKLYGSPLILSEAQIEELLAQDRATLIADLELVLHDAVVRYQYFDDLGTENYACLHALILLCHFQSTASIPAILYFLSQPEQVLDWCLGDILGENVSAWLAPLLQNDLTAFDSLILDTDSFEFARITALAAIEQFAFHWPDQKSDVEDHLLQLLTTVNAQDPEPHALDVINGYIGNVAVSTKMPRLFAALKPLYEAYKVDFIMIGDWDDAQEDFERPVDGHDILPLHLDNLRFKYTRDLSWTQRT